MSVKILFGESIKLSGMPNKLLDIDELFDSHMNRERAISGFVLKAELSKPKESCVRGVSEHTT